MLVLSRRIGDEVMIAGNIRVVVLAVKGKQVSLGITAPRSIPVVRLELLPERSAAPGAQTTARSGGKCQEG